jgi:4-amino-4-deoxy-L-arabinose transferase-like glycosyltransferase
MKSILIFAILFVLMGIILIQYPGLDGDELLFARPYFGQIDGGTHFMHVFRYQPDVMVLSYVGALKTFLYWPLFWIFRSSVYLVRLPMVLAGAATIVIFYKWAGRLAGPSGALIAATLLATDPIFLLTDTFDWGPVALQHLLVVSGCLLIASGRLSWGTFLFGLALWNKAIFAWTLGGLVLAVLLVYPTAVCNVLADRRRWIRAGLAFAVGVFPLVIYNVKHPNTTLGDNAHFSLEHLPTKYRELTGALDGSGLQTYLVAAESQEDSREARSLVGRGASWIRKHAGPHYESLMPFAILLAVPIALVFRKTPAGHAALFAIVCGAVTFVAMAVTRNAGMAIHHTVLLWPMPQLLVGAAFGSLPWRWLRVGLGSLVVAANLLVINQYIVQFERNGSGGLFTDAVNPLAASLSGVKSETVYFIDWGIWEAADFLGQGNMDLRESYAPLIQAMPDAGQRREIDTMIADRHALFVDHIPLREEFRGVEEHLEAIAGPEGYEKVPVQVVNDRNGRPVFQVFRLRLGPHASSLKTVTAGAALP